MAGKSTAIAYVVPYRFIPPKNGGHWAGFHFCRFLSQVTEMVCITTLENADPNPYFPVIKLFGDHPGKYFDPRVARRIISFCRRQNVRYCMVQQPFLVPLLWLFAAPVGLPLITYAHNLEFRRFRTLGRWWWPLLFLWEGLAFRLSHRVMFISIDEVPLAQRVFGLSSSHCLHVPYGTTLTRSAEKNPLARQELLNKHRLPQETILFFFLGPQTYAPNREAVNWILDQLFPLLSKDFGSLFAILIAGGGNKDPRRDIPALADGRVITLGYVDDLALYWQGTDIMLNPIFSGGGIKTKLMEALAHGLTTVSTREGAKGVKASACGEKLHIVPSDRPEDFLASIRRALPDRAKPTPETFFKTYYWGHIVVQTLRRLGLKSQNPPEDDILPQ